LWSYHLIMHRMFLKFQREDFTYTSGFMRIWNEGATLILFAMIFLAVVRHSLNWIYGLVGLVALAVLLMLGIRLYKKLRKD